MFTVEERDRVRERLLALAEADPAVGGAAITGSYVVAGGDEWSDIDLAFSIGGELPRALERWAARARGIERALLQATPLGRPVYVKAGYREQRTLPVLRSQ